MTYTASEGEYAHYICDHCGKPIHNEETYVRTVEGEVGIDNGHPRTMDRLFRDIYHEDCAPLRAPV